MRAQTIYKKAYIFDFDETLVKTDAKIHIYNRGAFVTSITPKEYNFYIKKPGDKLDFSDFVNGDLILNAKKHNAWPILRNISNAIREDRTTSDIYILTARSKAVKSYIYEFLKKHGIEIELEHIITIGDDKGDINIAEEKRKILRKLMTKYDEITFFDDDPANIRLAQSIRGIKTRLIENAKA